MEMLKKAGLAQEVVVERTGNEANNRCPFIGFDQAIRD
jgi:hypothetical protein